jgi:hypothetical protein
MVVEASFRTANQDLSPSIPDENTICSIDPAPSSQYPSSDVLGFSVRSFTESSPSHAWSSSRGLISRSTCPASPCATASTLIERSPWCFDSTFAVPLAIRSPPVGRAWASSTAAVRTRDPNTEAAAPIWGISRMSDLFWSRFLLDVLAVALPCSLGDDCADGGIQGWRGWMGLIMLAEELLVTANRHHK